MVEAAVEKHGGSKRKIHWTEVCAGKKLVEVYGSDVWLPQETLEAVRDCVVSIKGPLTNPVGASNRSPAVSLSSRVASLKRVSARLLRKYVVRRRLFFMVKSVLCLCVTSQDCPDAQPLTRPLFVTSTWWNCLLLLRSFMPKTRAFPNAMFPPVVHTLPMQVGRQLCTERLAASVKSKRESIKK